jgi:hypothetical protein
MKKFLICIAIVASTLGVFAAERFVSTTGTVRREITADRAAMTVRITARDKTIESSNKRLEELLRELYAKVAVLNYPTSGLSLRFRSTNKAREYDNEKKTYLDAGFDASASVSVILVGLTNYSELLTYLGTRDHHQIIWQTTGSSAEGDARRNAISEALRAARTKAGLLAEEGNARLGKLLEVSEEEVETKEFEGSTWGGNTSDPFEGTGAYPIGIFVKVRAKFELLEK